MKLYHWQEYGHPQYVSLIVEDFFYELQEHYGGNWNTKDPLTLIKNTGKKYLRHRNFTKNTWRHHQGNRNVFT